MSLGRTLVIASLALGGCRVPDEIFALAGDGGTDAPLVDALGCDVLKPFGTPAPIAELTHGGFNQESPRLTHDERTIYYWSGEINGTDDVLTASRASLGDPFGPLAQIGIDTTTNDELDPSVTGDDLTIYYVTDTSGTREIWSATRGTTTDTFSNGAPVANVNTSAQEVTPFITPDNLSLFFAAGPFNMWSLAVATRPTKTDPFTIDSSSVAALNVAGFQQRAPVLTLDRLKLYFASDQPPAKSGTVDIWVATRNSRSMPFGSPEIVLELGSTFIQHPGWISDDGCRLYLDRDDGTGKLHMFVATKPP